MKLLKVTCPNHAYPIKNKLKESSMMKNYMTVVALIEGDPTGKATAPFPREEAVLSIYNGPPMSLVISSNL
jgi:hypothetical protein